MLDLVKAWHVDALFGALMLVYIAYAKVSAYRFRKRAVLVKGVVLKVFPHSRFTSYFVSYAHDGSTRVAEYCGAPLIREYKVGATLEILIDGSAPPDVPLPGEWHNAPGAHSGNCSLPGAMLFTPWDFVYVLASVYLVAQSFGWVSFRLGS